MTVVELVSNVEDCLNHLDSGFSCAEVKGLHQAGIGTTIYFEDMFSKQTTFRVVSPQRFLLWFVDDDHLEDNFSMLTVCDLETLESKVVLCNRDV